MFSLQCGSHLKGKFNWRCHDLLWKCLLSLVNFFGLNLSVPSAAVSFLGLGTKPVTEEGFFLI